MAETGVVPDRRSGDRQTWRCLGRIGSTAAVALAGLALALGAPVPTLETILVVGVWLWLAAAVTFGLVQMVWAVNAAVSREEVNINPFFFMRRPPRVCAWAGVFLLAVATGALFEAGKAALAVTMEIFLVIRLAMSLAPDSEFMPETKEDPFEKGYTPIASGAGIFGVVAIAGPIWLAQGSSPLWAQGMILTYFWIAAVMMIAGNCIIAFSFISRPWMEKGRREHLRRHGGRSDVPPQRSPPITPEPAMTTRQQLTMWFWRAGWIAVTWALWTAGQPLLASLYLLGGLLKLTMRVRARRMKHGDSARIDFFARAVHLVVWWPLAAAAVTFVTAILIPFVLLAEIWERVFGTSAARPQTDREREQRLERARIRRAAASYRLREAFGKPDGFVYFLYAEPHQRAHFLSPGGLLADLGDFVVARNWRADILTARKATGSRRFRQTPEGALLHVNGITSLQTDLPLIAVVPERGSVQVFRLADAYRARRRDKGAALAQAEAEIRAAIAVTAGRGAGGPTPTG